MTKQIKDFFGDTIEVKNISGKAGISFLTLRNETQMALSEKGLDELINALTELKEELEKQQNDN